MRVPKLIKLSLPKRLKVRCLCCPIGDANDVQTVQTFDPVVQSNLLHDHDSQNESFADVQNSRNYDARTGTQMTQSINSSSNESTSSHSQTVYAHPFEVPPPLLGMDPPLNASTTRSDKPLYPPLNPPLETPTQTSDNPLMDFTPHPNAQSMHSGGTVNANETRTILSTPQSSPKQPQSSQPMSILFTPGSVASGSIDNSSADRFRRRISTPRSVASGSVIDNSSNLVFMYSSSETDTSKESSADRLNTPRIESSRTTTAGFPLGHLTLKTFGVSPDDHARKTTFCFVEDRILGTGQFGRVYLGYKIHRPNSTVAIKITPEPTKNHGDAYNEFCVCKQLAKKQYEYANQMLGNVAHVQAAHMRQQRTLAEYIIVMDRYPGSLDDLLMNQSKMNMDLSESASFGATQELVAMGLTINLLRQCRNGLRQLRMVYENLMYNDWSPANLMVTDVDLPIKNDIVYKLADFGKCRPGSHKFGSAPYVSAVNEPRHQETRDLNSIAVMGIHMLSAFGTVENAIWLSIQSESAESQFAIPHERDRILRGILKELESGVEEPFHSSIVNSFFDKLALVALNEFANFEYFEAFLNDSIVGCENERFEKNSRSTTA